jgi:hypothetical protein
VSELRIRGWERWQSYRRDRGQPPWIKVHRCLMRDPAWVEMSDAQRGQLVAIWLLAADRDGVIPASRALIKKLCFMENEPDLETLVRLGFIEDDASLTPSRRQPDAPEERRGETEAETEQKTTAPDGRVEVVENTGRVDERPAILHGELLELANKRLGLGRLPYPDQAANKRILNDWYYSSAPKDPVEVACAIEGAADMRDRDLIGWESAKPGTPMTLKALNGPMTLADQGDGKAVRMLYDVAVEHWRKRESMPNERPTPTARLKHAVPSRVAEILKSAQPPEAA